MSKPRKQALSAFQTNGQPNRDQNRSISTVTRPAKDLIDELDNLRAAGAFKNVESLYGKYANPNAPEMTEEEFHAQLHAMATEWEQELDDLDTD